MCTLIHNVDNFNHHYKIVVVDPASLCSNFMQAILTNTFNMFKDIFYFFSFQNLQCTVVYVQISFNLDDSIRETNLVNVSSYVLCTEDSTVLHM